MKKNKDTGRIFSFVLTISDTWNNIKTECEIKLQRTQTYLEEELLGRTLYIHNIQTIACWLDAGKRS